MSESSDETFRDGEDHEFAFDLKLNVALRVTAKGFDDAVKKLKEKLDCADANFGAWDNGNPILGEATLNGPVTKDTLFEIDGDVPEVCPKCEAIEGSEAWGTVGDGYNGYCPSCADKMYGDDE